MAHKAKQNIPKVKGRTAAKIGSCFICPDEQQVASALEGIFIERAKKAISERGRFKVALSGGTTPAAFFKKMRGSLQAQKLDWSRIYIFFCDERVVEAGSPSNNYGVAHKLWLGDLRFRLAQVAPMFAPKSMKEAPSIKEAVDAYETLLVHQFRTDNFIFDLVFLGVGEDGHTASLFGDSKDNNPEWARSEKGWVMQSVSPAAPHDRISLTHESIGSSRSVVFHAVGAKKHTRILQILNGDDSIPAASITSQGDLLLVLDREAAFDTKKLEK